MGMTRAWGVNWGLTTSAILALGGHLLTRNRAFGVAWPIYAATLLGVWIYTVYDVVTIGPYTRWYNQSRNDLALQTQLVGRPESDVEKILGPASDISRSWTTTDIDTGLPVAGSRFVTTFNFAPLFFFPVSKFQVHCEHGTVQSLEMFDD